ncbi:MAG: hypothetical protein M1135_00280 [Candidatus Omnitrophica bacterium]|jgi:hypothetical protein|nr:hypothetical protein [Candidatus Omnitrophota bacterium]
MRKLFLIAGVLLFLGLVVKSYADPMGSGWSNSKHQHMGKMGQPAGMWGMQRMQKGSMMQMWKIKKDIATNCKYVMKIKAQMGKLKMQTIMSDPKLRRELIRIKMLEKKLNKDTSAKLQKNPQYKMDKHWMQIIHKRLQKDVKMEMRLQMRMINNMMW